QAARAGARHVSACDRRRSRQRFRAEEAPTFRVQPDPYSVDLIRALCAVQGAVALTAGSVFAGADFAILAPIPLLKRHTVTILGGQGFLAVLKRHIGIRCDVSKTVRGS